MANIDSLAASMQQMMNQLTQLQAELSTTRQAADAAQQQAAQAQAASAASDAALAGLKCSGKGFGGGPAASNAAGRGGLGIDTRVLGKPDYFDGQDAKWRDWCVVFKSYASLVNPRLRECMEQASNSLTPAIA